MSSWKILCPVPLTVRGNFTTTTSTTSLIAKNIIAKKVALEVVVVMFSI